MSWGAIVKTQNTLALCVPLGYWGMCYRDSVANSVSAPRPTLHCVSGAKCNNATLRLLNNTRDFAVLTPC